MDLRAFSSEYGTRLSGPNLSQVELFLEDFKDTFDKSLATQLQQVKLLQSLAQLFVDAAHTDISV